MTHDKGQEHEAKPHEPALKTVKVRLEIPTGTKSLDEPKTYQIQVEVRIFRVGGALREH